MSLPLHGMIFARKVASGEYLLILHLDVVYCQEERVGVRLPFNRKAPVHIMLGGCEKGYSSEAPHLPGLVPAS
jgi:hypothetical protein